MNATVFSEWLMRQGHQVVRSASSYWYDAGPRILQSFPYHRVIDPGEEEIEQLLRSHSALGLRYSARAEGHLGRVSYHSIVSSPYGLAKLSANARSCVSRGLRRCQIERISYDRLAGEGWNLQRDTLERQHRDGGVTEAQWRVLCLGARDLDGFEAWGALVDRKLAASILVARVDDTAYLLYPQSHRVYFKCHVNNALVYTLTTELLSRPGLRVVFYGLESLDAPPSVDEFKFRMGYEAKPVRQRVVFHPLLAPLCNRFSHSLIRKFQRGRPENVTLAKAEGLLRFHLEIAEPVEAH